MKRLVLVALVCVLLMPAASPAFQGEYGYPTRDAYNATLLGTPSNLKLPPPHWVPERRLVLDIIPGLKRPDVFFYDEGLRCTFAYQRTKAPLVFVIAGTGASDRSLKALAILRDLYNAGYHVITIPSPTNPNFIISASRSHVPGDLAADAADIYEAMKAAWKEVKGDIEVSDFYLTGYSLGGTHAAFVAKHDEEHKVFNFRRVLLLNPAVNLYSSIKQIENMLERIPGGPRRIGAYLNRMVARLTDFYRTGNFEEINDEFLYSVFDEKLFNQDESGGLIAVSFRISLAGLIFASDVMTNGGYVVPKNRVLTGYDPLGDYFLVSFHLSFYDFFNEFFYPRFTGGRPGMTRGEVSDYLSIKTIEGYLKASPKISVITNENDFILTPAELAYLKSLFGPRVTVYPWGGHLGNLEHRDYMTLIINYFRQ